MDSYAAPTTPLTSQPPQMPDQGYAPTEASANPPRSKKPLLFLVVGLLIIVVGAVLALTVFRNMLFGTSSTKDVSLTYWGLWENKEVMQGLIDEYHQKNPHVTINYEERPLDNHYATVKARISSSTASNAPDIVRLHSSWIPILANYLSPIPSTVMTKADYENNFYSVTKDTLLKGNDYIGMPLTIDGLALVYNQDLMNQAGITSVPKTWDDVRQAAAKITKRTDKGVITTAGIAMGTANNVDHFSEILGLLMAQNGVSITNSQGKVAFATSTSPDGNNLGAEALAFYTLFASSSEKVWDDKQESSTLAFTKGNVGMILVPSWRVLSLVEQNPQMSIRVTTAPQLAGNQNIGYASYWVETVPSVSPNKTEAWKFLAWLSQPDQQSRLYADAQQVRSLAQPPANIRSASVVSSDLFLSPYIEQAKGYRASILASNTGADELNTAIDAALAEAVTATLKATNKRYEAAIEALTVAATQVTTVLEKQR